MVSITFMGVNTQVNNNLEMAYLDGLLTCIVHCMPLEANTNIQG